MLPVRSGTLAVLLLLPTCLAGRLDAADPPKLVAETPPLSPEEQLTKFRLPPGFRIELIAAEPEVPKPINLNFDAAGRLYATCSLEYPYPAEDDRTPRDAIKRIVDTDGNGVPDTVTTFADRLNIPIGVTPVAGGVLGYSIPSIRRFRDADGDGRADGCEVAYAEFGSKDTHGMASSFTWWVDGWVYACHGFANTSTVAGRDGQAVTMHSGSTYRLRPDGSRIEQYTRGQVNPFGLTFDPLGNVYTSDCHSRPIYMLVRGAYYPSFGKPHDGLGYGPEMMQHSHGSTGIAGAVYYAADQFPPEYRGTMFVGNPVTGIINHDRLEAHGSSYTAIELPDFLTCDDPWFRPVDLQLAPDGSLYVADFYNSIIGHYEVPLDHPKRDRERGRIWRISYVGTDGQPPPGTPAPDLTSVPANELLRALGHPNLVVRTHATHQLVHRIGEPAVEKVKTLLSGASSAEQRAHGVWVLARRDALDSEIVRRLAGDPERLVRVHLIKALAERPQWTDEERRVVLEKFGDPDAFVRRAAADAVGRHPHPDCVEALLRLWQQTPDDDPQLIHTIRIALRDTVQALENLPQLADRFWNSPADLARLAEISRGIRSAQSAAFLLAYLREQDEPPSGDMLHHIGRYGDEETLNGLYHWAVSFAGLPADRQHEILLALNRAARERNRELPESLSQWGASLTVEFLGITDGNAVRRGIELARELRLAAAAGGLAAVAADRAREPALRSDALNTLAGLDKPLALRALSDVLNAPDEPLALRQSAAERLGSLNTEESRAALIAQLRTAPQAVAVAIARGLAGSPAGAEALLAGVEQGTTSPRVLQDATVRERLQSLNVEQLSARLEELVRNLPPADERLQQLVAERRDGFQKAHPDPALGAELFRKNCAACHRLGNEGTKVGPELDGIGLRGLDRLLEDVLDPSRNVDAAFRASVVALTDGRILTGLIVREEGTTLVLVDERGQEHRIAQDEIDARRASRLSPMPANVSELLTEDEFYHLMAYLLQQRSN